MSKFTDLIINQVLPLVDKDGDGKFTENDVKVAVQKYEDQLKSKQSNMLVVATVGAGAFLVGSLGTLVLCLLRH